MRGLNFFQKQIPERRIDVAELRMAELCLSAATRLEEIRGIALRDEWGTRVALGDLFVIEPREDDTVCFEGDLTAFDGLGSDWAEGTLEIRGNTGDRTGQRMSGGRIVVAGNAGDGTGMGMSGGSIQIKGNAGEGSGGAPPGAHRGMSGGEIVIAGNAGRRTGACMRRGLIAVGGTLGEEALHAALAGTVVALGRVGHSAGRWNKRGSLVAFGEIEVPRTYPFACETRFTMVRVVLRHLRTRYGFPVAEEQMAARFARYCGDMAEGGRGEILKAVAERSV